MDEPNYDQIEREAILHRDPWRRKRRWVRTGHVNGLPLGHFENWIDWKGTRFEETEKQDASHT